MDRLTKKNGDGYSLNHVNCPMHGQCYDSADCVQILLERLAAYEEIGWTPEDIKTAQEALAFFRRDNASLVVELKRLKQDIEAGWLVRMPFVAMVEQSLQCGLMKPPRDQAHNGRYAVVYNAPEKWGCPLIDICGTHYNSDQAEARRAELSGEGAAV